MGLGKKHTRSNIFIIDTELWAWAKYNAEIQGFKSVSEYIFNLIRKDKENLEQLRTKEESGGGRSQNI